MTAIQFVDRVSGAPLGPHRTVLARAATDALTAPSIFNSQPWRWRIGHHTAQLRADRSRQVTTVDAEGRLLTISCGAALHHARVALAAAGFTPEVTYLPDPADPDLLAVMRCGAPVAPDPAILRRYRAMSIRHTDRRPFLDAPVGPQALEALARAATGYGAHLHYPQPDAMVGLTMAAGHAATREQADPAYIADRYARYAILYTAGDAPHDWLAAGEALSAVLLEASILGLGTAPMSDLIEVPRSRRLVRDLLAGVGYPAMVIRVGVPPVGASAPPATPRRPTGTVVEVPR